MANGRRRILLSIFFVAVLISLGCYRKAGDSLQIDLGDGVVLDLVWIPQGHFMMGSPTNELGRSNRETPQHRVKISQGFWLGKYPVTQRQYQRMMVDNPSHFKKAGPDAPVEMVSWYEAKDFCLQLQEHLPSVLRGWIVRLPTEAEWEYSCRAGSTTALYTGKELSSRDGSCTNLDEIAWYRNNSAKTTHPAGRKLPNAWGLYDTLGNVSEWCEDGLRNYTSGPQTNPIGEMGSSRVIRGGVLGGPPFSCRSAYRSWSSLDRRSRVIGFRVIVSRQALPSRLREADPANNK